MWNQESNHFSPNPQHSTTRSPESEPIEHIVPIHRLSIIETQKAFGLSLSASNTQVLSHLKRHTKPKRHSTFFFFSPKVERTG